MLKNAPDLQRLAFLDTNVLHFMDLYIAEVPVEIRYPRLGVAEQDEMDGVLQCAEDASFKRTVAYIASEKERGEREFWDSVGNGLKAVKFIRDGCDGTPYQVEYAPVSELELMEGRVRGSVVEQFAREGAPPRMWTRGIPEKVVESRVGREKRKEIWQGVGGLRQALGDMDIQVADSRTGNTIEVMDLAKRVMRNVHLSVCDAIVYASAMVARAEYVVTTDRHLYRVVMGIKRAATGGGDRIYRKAAEEIRGLVVGELPDSHLVRVGGKQKRRQKK